MLDNRLTECVARTFKLEPSAVTRETAPANTPTWDSISHLNLIFEVEDVFGVRLSTEEIPRVTSAGSLEEILRSRKAL
jgi:acyl carrier protein